jgi:endonuclease/exonuclease/phosphatase family metal-dependent hydrolase
VQARLITYNIHKGIGGIDRRYRPFRIGDTIAHYEPDIVCLQEVDEGVPRSNGDRQVDLLGDLVGLRHRTWFPNVPVRGGHYGNAILSRFHLTDTENIDLTIGSRKPRSVLHARYRVRRGGGRKSRTLHVFNLHLGLSGSERAAQLERFLRCDPFAHLHARTPVIVAGDFNDVWGTLGRRFLLPQGFRGPERPIFTFPAFAPARALDSVWVRGDVRIGRVYRSQLGLARTASDHLPLIAELELL